MSASNGDNGRRNNYKHKYTRTKKPSSKTDGSATQESSGKGSQLSREERGQNLQFRNVNMQKYEHMIDTAKDNFADIALGSGPTEECTICCKVNDLFGIGSCRHPVCMECAIRMRVLSNSRQCPVCRADMETLWFVFVSSGFDTVSLPLPSLNHPDEKRFGLQFQDVEAITRYEKYLAHVCKLCRSPEGGRMEFPTFVALRHHMSSVHQLTYCHICTENITLFSRERKTYTRDGLQRHIRAGDRDDKSLKGHPSCLFCEQRFFDEEFRYKHLRKEHFFCQFCESEGKHMNVFFKDHGELVGHYKEQHFLCDFEDCKAMGIAFSNQIDLNLHKSKEHNGRRTAVGLDFQFSDRQLAGPSRVRPPANSAVIRRDKVAVVPQEATLAPKRTPEEFVVVPSAQSSSRTIRYNVAPAYTPQSEDFPSLAPTSANSRSVPTLPNLRPDDFPRLNRVNHPGVQPAQSKPSPVVENFPALPTASKQLPTAPSWGTKKTSKSVVVGCKVPNNIKQLPQPDVWPDRPVSTPAREIEPERWQEVPTKPRKVDKKTRRVQQKAANVSNEGASEVPEVSNEDPHRSELVLKNSSKIGSEEKFEEDKQKGISKQNSISQTYAIKREDNVPSVSIPIPAINKLNKSHSGAGKIEQRFAAGTKTSDDVLSEVERYTEKSTTTPPEASSQSSILNWFSLPSKSSLFSNLSLSNVLGKTPQENCMAPTPFASTGSEVVNSPSTPITDVATETKKTASALADVPPGLATAVPADILSGPPPGFEGICPDSSAPPGLVFPSVSRPVFSMAPFFSNADLNKNDVGSETASKADNEWSAVGAR